jgi:hypothetical protein
LRRIVAPVRLEQGSCWFHGLPSVRMTANPGTAVILERDAAGSQQVCC